MKLAKNKIITLLLGIIVITAIIVSIYIYFSIQRIKNIKSDLEVKKTELINLYIEDADIITDFVFKTRGYLIESSKMLNKIIRIRILKEEIDKLKENGINNFYDIYKKHKSIKEEFTYIDSYIKEVINLKKEEKINNISNNIKNISQSISVLEKEYNKLMKKNKKNKNNFLINLFNPDYSNQNIDLEE